MDNAEALRALEDLQGTLGYLPDGHYDRATDAVEKLRAHLTDTGYVRVPVEPTPDVVGLVEALDLALEYWRHRQQRYKNLRPKWVIAAESALAAHHKGESHD